VYELIAIVRGSVESVSSRRRVGVVSSPAKPDGTRPPLAAMVTAGPIRAPEPGGGHHEPLRRHRALLL